MRAAFITSVVSILLPVAAMSGTAERIADCYVFTSAVLKVEERKSQRYELDPNFVAEHQATIMKYADAAKAAGMSDNSLLALRKRKERKYIEMIVEADNYLTTRSKYVKFISRCNAVAKKNALPKLKSKF